MPCTPAKGLDILSTRYLIYFIYYYWAQETIAWRTWHENCFGRNLKRRTLQQHRPLEKRERKVSLSYRSSSDKLSV
jgi:hypothetical protein